MNRFDAALGLWRKYHLAWKCAWSNRQANASVKRKAEELQFLPATLELQEKPPHPAAHWVLAFLLLFSAIAFLWSCLGKIDVVATAEGKVIASGMSKFIQASEVSIVKAVLVQEGRAVTKGQVLIELEAVNSQADVNRLKAELVAAQSDWARATALLKAIEEKSEPQPIQDLMPGAPLEQVAATTTWLRGQYIELNSKIGQMDAEVNQFDVQIISARTNIKTAAKVLSISTRVAESSKNLAEGGYLPRNAYLERERLRIDHVREIELQQNKIRELQASIRITRQRRDNLVDQVRIAMLDLEGQSRRVIKSVTQELEKAEYRHRLMSLVSPIDGTVQELSVHTVGGVVTAAQNLMVVVPHTQPSEADVWLDNKDIGFVYPGQEVAVKIDSFNYVKYGVFIGKVVSISQDSISSEEVSSKYSVRIKLNAAPALVVNRKLVVSPGMTLTAELELYKRSVLGYFIEPLWRSLQEGLRER